MPFEAKSVTCQVMEGNLLVIDAFTAVAEVSGVPCLLGASWACGAQEGGAVGYKSCKGGQRPV